MGHMSVLPSGPKKLEMLDSHYFSRSRERESLIVFTPVLDPREPVECVDVMLKPFDDAQDNSAKHLRFSDCSQSEILRLNAQNGIQIQCLQ